jgi:hypothetical protein
LYDRFGARGPTGQGREAPNGLDQHESPFHTKETFMETITETTCRRTAWNKGKLIGQKSPLKLKDLGNQDSAATRMSNARIGAVQPCDR